MSSSRMLCTRSITRSLCSTRSGAIQRISMAHKPETSRTTAHLEVESKFNVTSLLRSQLEGTHSSRPTLSLAHPAAISLLKFTRQPQKLINDQYFDLEDKLCSKGIWVRRRTERTLVSHDFPFRTEEGNSIEWEAKVRVGGDYQSSQFEELVGEEVVMDLVKKHVPNVGSLRKVVDINTFREAWKVREHVERVMADQGQRMLVVIDSSTASGGVGGLATEKMVFRQMVGEVELTLELEVGEDEAKSAGAKLAASAVLKRELDNFMERHASLFPTWPAPVGKLTAYFAWKKLVGDRLEEHS